MQNNLSNQSPFLSIITVCYNASQTIASTINSVINQSYQNFEYIIVDGGSNDGTLDIINEFGLNRFKLISEPDNGIYDAMNKGVSIASGERLFFLGADDVFFENYTLETFLSKVSNDSSIYYGDVYFKKRGVTYDGYFSKYKLCLRNISHQAIFYPSNLLKENKYDLKYKLLADYVLNLKLHKKHKFIYLPITVTYFNDDAQSANNLDLIFEAIKFNLVRENLGLMPYWYAKTRRLLKQILIH